MCGICFRSVYIQSKIGAEDILEPLVSFVTGVFPYHTSREGATLTDAMIDLPTSLTEGTLVVRNMGGDLK